MERVFGKTKLFKFQCGIGEVISASYAVFDNKSNRLGTLEKYKNRYLKYRFTRIYTAESVDFKIFADFIKYMDSFYVFNFKQQHPCLPPVAEAITKSGIFKASIVPGEVVSWVYDANSARTYHVMILVTETGKCASKRELEALGVFDIFKNESDYSFVYDVDESEDRAIRHVSRKNLLEFLEKC